MMLGTAVTTVIKICTPPTPHPLAPSYYSPPYSYPPSYPYPLCVSLCHLSPPFWSHVPRLRTTRAPKHGKRNRERGEVVINLELQLIKFSAFLHDALLNQPTRGTRDGVGFQEGSYRFNEPLVWKCRQTNVHTRLL